MDTAPKVLVVDDDCDVADSIARLVRAKGYVVCTAYDGWDAIETIETFKPRAALLDINLPTVSGYDIARHIRSTCDPDVLLIAISAHSDPVHKAHASAAGFDHHFTKPPDFVTLLDILERHCSLPAAAG